MSRSAMIGEMFGGMAVPRNESPRCWKVWVGSDGLAHLKVAVASCYRLLLSYGVCSCEYDRSLHVDASQGSSRIKLVWEVHAYNDTIMTSRGSVYGPVSITR